MQDQSVRQLPIVLWCQQTKRHKWREIGRAPTGPQALALMDTSGIHGGNWMCLPLGEDPNTKPGDNSQSLNT